VAVLLVAADALVVVDAVTAAVQDEFAPVHLERARVVRRMPVDDVGAAVDEQVGKVDLVRRHAVSPVRPPVNRDDHDITRLPGLMYPAADGVGGAAGQVRQEVPAWPASGSGPALRDAAGLRATREDEPPPAGPDADGHGRPGAIGVGPGA